MQTTDILLTNAHILTMDEQMNQFNPGAIAINGDSIIAVGPEADIKKEYAGRETVDCGGSLLMPGLINAHTHVPMTLLRGLADDLRLDVWLSGYMWPVEREFVSPEFVRLGTQIACAELIRSGVTTFNDMYFYEESVAKATAEAGMRAVCGQSVLKFPVADADSYEDSMEIARDYIQRWKGHPLIIPSIAPHAPYTTTPEILRATAELAKEFDVPLHIHIAETSFEVENMRNENGMPVVPYVKKQGLFEAKVIAAHCVHIDPGEMRTLLHAGAGVSHNPSSNLKLASGFAPVMKMLETGLNVGIGTDGPASNNDLDMFEEVRLAAFIAKAVTNDPTSLPAATALTMATRLGAQALHIGHLTGSLTPGRRADLILIDGGRGQLNAALTALNRLGIEGITVAGLAKREEEIYVPEREAPIRLERRDPALQLLQTVRDETHRFAVSSHRRRRSKRTLHSELEDLPGIGDKRRRLLIERFGSLSGVKQASEQDLINVLGRKIGKTLYAELHPA